MLLATKILIRSATPQEFTNYMLFHAPGFNSSDGACEPLPEDRFWKSLMPLTCMLLAPAGKLFHEWHAAGGACRESESE